MSGPALTVLSWNVRKAVGTDWRRDPARIVRLLAGMRPDLVFLQEADKRVPPRPAAIPPGLLGEAGLTPVAAPGPGIGWHGNAVLLGPRLACEAVEPVDLPGLEPRGALLARVATPIGALIVGSLHLGLTRGSRRRQLAHLSGLLAEREGPVLLAGDLNEWSARRGFEPLGPGWRVHAPGPSFHAMLPRLALDRVLTRGAVAVTASAVLRGPELRVASDHLPVRAEVVGLSSKTRRDSSLP